MPSENGPREQRRFNEYPPNALPKTGNCRPNSRSASQRTQRAMPAVAGMVKDDKLTVEASNDNFGDPIEGTVKKLKVEYTVNGVAHSKTVNEGETLSISGKPARLVIRKAVYGDLPDGANTDVTEKVADKVNDDKLSIEATNDNFGDPAEGIVKKLKVDYTFDGKERSKTVDENATLTISDNGESPPAIRQAA